MTRWRPSQLPGRNGGPQAAPYWDWVRATRFAYYGQAGWLPLLIELRASTVAAGTAQAFADYVLKPPAHGDGDWRAGLRLPAFYASPPSRMKRPTRHVSLLMDWRLLERVCDGKQPELAQCIQSIELGRAVASSAWPAPPPAALPSAAGQPQVVVGVVDDGMAFGHDRFLDSGGGTRVEYYWDQATPSAAWGDWGYGRERSKRDPQQGIDVLMASCRHGVLLDEDELYRRSGDLDHARPGHKALASIAAHGTHVMDLACGETARPAPGLRPIVAVQLPVATVADTSGATLGPQVYNALCYIVHSAERIATSFGGGTLPVVANVSYGLIAGPHDGSSQLESAIDQLVLSCGHTLRVVLPAGNSRQSRCHARFSLDAGRSRELVWRLLPDDLTESQLQIRLPPGATQLQAVVTTPDGQPTPAFGCGVRQQLLDGNRVVGQASFYAPGVAGVGAVLWLHLAPTADPEGHLGLAPAGRWRVRLANPAGMPRVRDIHAWIQRDDTAPGHARRGRQSYFDDPAYRRHDGAGRRVDVDNTSPIKRDGSHSAMATGRHAVVIGGYRRSDGKAAEYSAGGPLPPPGRGAPNRDGPEALLPSDDSAAMRGLLGAGTRSGAVVAMNGTSVAAPLAARQIATALGYGLPSDRQAVFAAALAQDPWPTNKPAIERGGGGRLPVPHNRRAVRREA